MDVGKLILDQILPKMWERRQEIRQRGSDVAAKLWGSVKDL